MTDAIDEKARDLAAALADQLAASGAIRTREWREVVARTFRHPYLPVFYKQEEIDGWIGWRRVDRQTPEEWLRDVYQDITWVTKLKTTPILGAPAELLYGSAISSGTMPSLLLYMLEELEVRDGQRVLDVGTGTGYLTALLCERLGSANVVSVDVDPQLVRLARERLAAQGHHPTLAAADGAAGYPEGAPYDRVIATCSVSTVPAAWLEQCRPGAVIVADVRGRLGGQLAKLTVDDRGGAQGRFLPRPGSFMPMRTGTGPDVTDLLRQVDEDAAEDERITRLAPDVLDDQAFRFFAQLHLPGVGRILASDPDTGDWVTYLLATDGSWAAVSGPDSHRTVRQHGSRRLWDTLEEAYATWTKLDQPGWDRFSIHVEPDGSQTVRFDAGDMSWPL